MVNQRKRDIVTKLCQCFTDYKQCVVVAMDNVSTNQIHKARALLRAGDNKGEMIIGKNTLIKKALKFKTQKPDPTSEDYEDHKQWTQDTKLEALLPLMRLNVGLVFSEAPYMELRKLIEAEKIKMPARTGVLAPCDVIIEAGPTGIEVGKIDLFHKLNISCKTVRSAIEVVKPVQIITRGQKVTEGAVRMCKVLAIIPFEYSLTFQQVYLDGVILDQDIIEMDMDLVLDAFKRNAAALTHVSLGANIPNALSVPHFIATAFKSCLAIGEASGYSFKQLEDAKNASANVVTVVETCTAKEVKKEAVKEEEVEEASEDMDMGGMFD